CSGRGRGRARPGPENVWGLAEFCRFPPAAAPSRRPAALKPPAVRPDTNRKSPPLTAIDSGWPEPPAASGARAGRGMTSRLALIGCPSRSSGGGHHVELDLEAGFNLRRPHRARRRPVSHVLPIDTIEHVVLDAVIDQRMHLYEPIERRAGRLQQQLQISKNDVRLGGEGAVAALPCLRIDR